MNKLFLDTSFDKLRIGLIKNQEILSYDEIDATRKFTEITVPTIQQTLSKYNLNVHDLEEIYVTIGPGSFTGTRVGLTIAKTWNVLNPELRVYVCDSLKLQVHGKDETSLIDARGKKDYYLHNGEYGICKTGDIISKNRNFENYHFRISDLNWFQHIQDPKTIEPFYIKKAVN